MNTAQSKEQLARINSSFPRAAALRVTPVIAPSNLDGYESGYDIDDVKGLLGTARFNNLMAQIVTNKSSLFCCDHRLWPANHADVTKQGAEVHCIRASDLEAFLKGGG